MSPPLRVICCYAAGPPEGTTPLLLVGIDIGGTKLALAAGDEHGQILAGRRRPIGLSGDAARDLAAIAHDVRALVAEAGASLSDVAAVGVSVPGPLDSLGGRVLNPPNLPGWDGAPVRQLLGDALGRPVHLENDANAAALAEWRYGAARGTQHAVYLTMSTGVGGGLILGGRLHRGVAWSAGEVGHLPLVWGGEPCACGLHGCVEAYIGGRAWAQRLRRVAPPDGRVAELAGGLEHIRPEDLVGAAKEGDAFALGEMARFNDHLARTLVTLTFVLAPEIFVLGTICTAAGETLCFAPVRERVREHVWEFLARDLRIVPAELGEHLPELAGLSVAADAVA